MREALRRFWAERSERERVVIAGASILAALALAYAYIWLPVARERDRLLDAVPRLRTEAQEVGLMALELARMQRARSMTSVEVGAAIEQATRAESITELEVTTEAARRARATIRAVSPAKALSWIGRLHSTHGMRPEQLRMTTFDGEQFRIEVVFHQTQ